MKTIITLTAVMTMLCCGAHYGEAAVPHFFIGANAQWNDPTGDFGEAADEVEGAVWDGNAAGVMGGQFDAGVISDNGQLYFGYRLVNFDEKDADGSVEWKNNSRWLAGLRWHVINSLEAPITPILGAGVSAGKTEGIFKQPGPGDMIIAELTSDMTWGWFVEGGAAFRIPEAPIVLNGGVQYHRYEASFEHEDLNIEFSISYLTYQLGAQIYF